MQAQRQSELSAQQQLAQQQLQQPITAAQTFASGMNSACRSPNGVFYNIKNPYNTSERLCRLSISYTNDNDVGYVNWSEKSGSEIRLRSCWKTPCSSSDNREEIIINVTQ